MTRHQQQEQQMNKQTHSYQLRSTTMKSIVTTTTTTTTKLVTSSTPQLNNTTLTGQRKTCGLFNTDQSQIIDTGTKETEINPKSTEMISFFDSNMDEKINFDDCCFLNFGDNLAGFGGDNNNNNSSFNATTPTSTCGDELNFEQFDLAEIMSLNTNTNNNNNNNNNNTQTDVFNLKSNLMKRVENKNNMKIQISKKEILRQDSFNLEVDDELKGLITPGITNVCQEFIKSLPTPNIPTLELNTNDLLIELQTIDDSNNNQELSPIKDYSTEKNPFVSALSADVNLQQQPVLQQLQTVTLEQFVFEDITPFESNNTSLAATTQKQISVETVTLDHDYTSTTKKRKISFDDESNSQFSFENSNTSFTTTTTTTTTTTNKKQKTETSTQQKRKRVKGIYRAGDVKTQEELENYRERRRKNNISSKQSRLSKKNLYLSMEEKSDQLENDNGRLKQQITHLENLTKLLKDVLLQRFTSNIK